MRRCLVPVLVVGLLSAGCGGASRAAPAQPGATPAQPGATPAQVAGACPAVRTPRFAWPRGFPADLPQPPGATPGAVQTTPQGLTVVRFRVASSLRDGVRFAVKALPAAGFTLGRGDSEQNEAELPFARGAVNGVLKLAVVGPCTTDWLAAVTAAGGGTSPLLPGVGASPSPSPFG